MIYGNSFSFGASILLNMPSLNSCLQAGLGTQIALKFNQEFLKADFYQRQINSLKGRPHLHRIEELLNNGWHIVELHDSTYVLIDEIYGLYLTIKNYKEAWIVPGIKWIDSNIEELPYLPNNLFVHGNVELSNNKIKYLPNIFRYIQGRLDISDNHITELFLNSCIIGNSLLASDNTIQRLELECTIGGSVDLANNRLKRQKITSYISYDIDWSFNFDF